MTHICVSKFSIIGSDTGLSPGRRQAIIWTKAGILLDRPLGTNFSEILIEIHTFSFKKMNLKISSGKWRPFCLGLNVLRIITQVLVFQGGGFQLLAPTQCYEVTENVNVFSCVFFNSAKELTHWGRDKMAAIFQTTFSNGFSSMKCMNFD